jgi:hypothetical protein
MEESEMRSKLWQSGALVLGIGLILGGCAGDRDMARRQASGPNADFSASEPVANAPAVAGNARSKAAGPKGGKEDSPALTLASMTDSEPDRYLIKNATLSLEAPDARKATDRLTGLVRAVKGYTSDAHESVDGLGARTVIIQARIPFPQFDQVMQQVETLGKVLDKQVTAEDVTVEFVDTQAKLRNLKKTEARLLDHLSKTGKLSDTLLIEKELNRVREEIERLEGRLRFLAHRIAFSTLNLTIKETPRPQAITPPESFSAGQVVTDAMRSLVGFAQSIVAVAIWLAIWAVVWLPLVLLVGYLVRREIKSVRKAKAERTVS